MTYIKKKVNKHKGVTKKLYKKNYLGGTTYNTTLRPGVSRKVKPGQTVLPASAQEVGTVVTSATAPEPLKLPQDRGRALVTHAYTPRVRSKSQSSLNTPPVGVQPVRGSSPGRGHGPIHKPSENVVIDQIKSVIYGLFPYLPDLSRETLLILSDINIQKLKEKYYQFDIVSMPQTNAQESQKAYDSFLKQLKNIKAYKQLLKPLFPAAKSDGTAAAAAGERHLAAAAAAEVPLSAASLPVPENLTRDIVKAKLDTQFPGIIDYAKGTPITSTEIDHLITLDTEYFNRLISTDGVQNAASNKETTEQMEARKIIDKIRRTSQNSKHNTPSQQPPPPILPSTLPPTQPSKVPPTQPPPLPPPPVEYRTSVIVDGSVGIGADTPPGIRLCYEPNPYEMTKQAKHIHTALSQDKAFNDENFKHNFEYITPYVDHIIKTLSLTYILSDKKDDAYFDTLFGHVEGLKTILFIDDSIPQILNIENVYRVIKDIYTYLNTILQSIDQIDHYVSYIRTTGNSPTKPKSRYYMLVDNLILNLVVNKPLFVDMFGPLYNDVLVYKRTKEYVVQLEHNGTSDKTQIILNWNFMLLKYNNYYEFNILKTNNTYDFISQISSELSLFFKDTLIQLSKFNIIQKDYLIKLCDKYYTDCKFYSDLNNLLNIKKSYLSPYEYIEKKNEQNRYVLINWENYAQLDANIKREISSYESTEGALKKDEIKKNLSKLYFTNFYGVTEPNGVTKTIPESKLFDICMYHNAAFVVMGEGDVKIENGFDVYYNKIDYKMGDEIVYPNVSLRKIKIPSQDVYYYDENMVNNTYMPNNKTLIDARVCEPIFTKQEIYDLIMNPNDQNIPMTKLLDLIRTHQDNIEYISGIIEIALYIIFLITESYKLGIDAPDSRKYGTHKMILIELQQVILTKSHLYKYNPYDYNVSEIRYSEQYMVDKNKVLVNKGFTGGAAIVSTQDAKTTVKDVIRINDVDVTKMSIFQIDGLLDGLTSTVNTIFYKEFEMPPDKTYVLSEELKLFIEVE